MWRLLGGGLRSGLFGVCLAMLLLVLLLLLEVFVAQCDQVGVVIGRRSVAML